jgi:hypothetical protein
MQLALWIWFWTGNPVSEPKKQKEKGEEISINNFLTVNFFIVGHHKPGSGPIPDSLQSLLPDSVPNSDPEH